MEKILIVDDEENFRFILSELLEKAGYKTELAENGKVALRKIKELKPEIILLDYKLPDLNGIEILKEIQNYDGNFFVIMMTAYGDIKNAVTSMKLGAFDYLTKPFDNMEILKTIQNAANNLRLVKKAGALQKERKFDDELKKMMGESEEIKRILSQVELVAKSDITVFLEGETGTGKDLIAKLIHKKSARHNKPFVAVDCGAIPETLFESEMFGHEKGAFTGANTTLIGKFEQANGGTLFLDEICNLPVNMQSKLLRAIQDKKIQRLGGKKLIDIDVRIIAACNSNIIEEIKISKFRKDLFYRINEFNIKLPTLQERREDIPAIASYFLSEIDSQNVKKISDKALQKLRNYHWPGNIRELKNVIKRAALICQNDTIEPEHLVFRDLKFEESTTDIIDNFKIDEVINKTRKEVIINALKRTKGNKTEAAKLLGISRRQLYWDLKKLKIEE